MTPGWIPSQPWIDGRETEGRGARLALKNPSTGEALVEVGTPDAAQVDRAVRVADAAFEDGRWQSVPVLERQRVLMRAAAALRDHDGELARLIAEEMGMPESAARYVEIPYAAAVFDYYAGLAASITGETLPVDIPAAAPHYLAYTERRPVGVAALITPFNFPLLLPAWKLAPALASGSAAVLKPAPEAPRVALALAVLLEQAGVPAGVVNVLPGGDAVGEALVTHPLVRKVSFTGSTISGRRVARLAGDQIKRVSLELGGKSPALVFADADLDNAVSQCLFGLYFNSGQVCQASSRILVQDAVYPEFQERFGARAEALRVGDATDPLVDLGPVVQEERLAGIQRLVDQGRRDGARLVTGGHRLPGAGYFYAPTVLTDVPPDSALSQEEVFGPVAALMPFHDEEEAVRLANGTRYGLAAAIFTADIRRAFTVSRALKSGTVWINTTQILSPTAPFGGVKQSGLGRELGRAGLDAFLETRTVLVDLNDSPPTYF